MADRNGQARRTPAGVIVELGTDPSPYWNEIRTLLGDRADIKEVVDPLDKDLEVIRARLNDEVTKWVEQFPQATEFRIGVNEKVGVLKIRWQAESYKSEVDVQKLLELGVDPALIQQATVTRVSRSGYPRVDAVKGESKLLRPEGDPDTGFKESPGGYPIRNSSSPSGRSRK